MSAGSPAPIGAIGFPLDVVGPINCQLALETLPSSKFLSLLTR